MNAGQRRVDVAVNAIYKCAPLGALAHGYPWEACYARATPAQRFEYKLASVCLASDRRDASLMHSLMVSDKQWKIPGEATHNPDIRATCGMQPAEIRALYGW